MTVHRPYGIDDPYKRLPTERFPRDPEAGDTVQIGFRADADVEGAHVELRHPNGATADHPAQSLGEGLWSATLPALPAGAHAYTIRTRTPAGRQDSETFDLPVGRWRVADRLHDVETTATSVTLLLATSDGEAEATLDARDEATTPPRAPAARLTLSFPLPGVCTTTFSVGSGPTHDAASPVETLPCTTDRAGGVLTVRADGIEVRVDEGSLEVVATRIAETEAGVNGSGPSGPANAGAQVRTTAATAWLELPSGDVARFRTGYDLRDDEELYGLGERFVGPGLRGREWDVRVYEEYKEQGARTYIPVPFFLSASAWGVWVQTDAPSYLDARGDAAILTVDAAPRLGGTLRQHLIVANEPYGVTQAFTRLTGDIALPPAWAYGPWMSANTWNTQAIVEAEVGRTLEEDVPATVLVIEAWSDESTFYLFNDAHYDPVAGGERLRADDIRFGGRWPDPKRMIDWCHEHGVRVVLWQIPVQKKLDEPHAQHEADEAHMLEHGYAIRHADGSPYRNAGWWFTDALVLDVTNPAARDWWFAKRRYLFDDLGIDGMKTDGGEHLWGRDLVSHDGRTGVELVNRYAQAYVDAYHSFVQERTDGDGLTFSRAGYTGAQRSPAHWAGDENSTWSAFRASIQAGLSAGLAGVSIWGWDIGGFSGEIPSVELYLRSTQMACFSPVMQYHSELHDAADRRDRTPWNVAERHGDPRALTVYRAYAQLRMRLLDYVATEAQALAAEGRPLMRYPGLVWPEMREQLMADPDTYLFGRDLLVAPVLEKGATTRTVTLPPGDWTDLWSGATFAGGGVVLAPAPLARIPVFVRADSPRLDALLDAAASFEIGSVEVG